MKDKYAEYRPKEKAIREALIVWLMEFGMGPVYDWTHNDAWDRHCAGAGPFLPALERTPFFTRAEDLRSKRYGWKLTQDALDFIAEDPHD